MSPAEVGARTARELAHRRDDLRHRYRHDTWERSWDPEQSWLLRVAQREPTTFLTEQRAHWLSTHDPASARRIVEAAERVMEGRYRYFGYPEVVLDRPIDYAADPHTGRRWPNRHAKRIDYRSHAPGDPKWIWELNRLQELPVLIQAWLITDDHVFRDHAVGLATDWIATNEPGRGIGWSNGYEPALRALSLLVTLDALSADDDGSLDPARRAIARSLWQHARWMKRDPSTHSSANNHRIGELAALTGLGLGLPECPESRLWLREGLDGLVREVELQIARDGTSAEQAFAYHLHTIDFVLVVVALLDLRSEAIPLLLLDALSRSGDALAVQQDDGEPELRYGDADDAWVLRLDGRERRDARAVAAGIAARTGHAGARRVAGKPDGAAYWMFGAEGVSRFEATPPASAPAATILPDAGLAVIRRGRTRLTFDAGPLGYLAIAAHGHADALSITLSTGAQELIVDPGTGSYFRHPEQRSAFRGTAMHATVCVDGLDQSQSGGPFMWRRHARSALLYADLNAGILLGEHDGYRALPTPVAHRRLVVFPESGPIVVLDRLRTDGSHRVTQTWPFHPDLALVTADSGRAALARGDEGGLHVQFAALGGDIHVSHERGATSPVRGWYARRLEEVEPASTVLVEATTDSPCLDIVAVISLTGSDENGVSALVSSTDGAVRIVLADAEATLVLDPDDVDAPARWQAQ